KKKRKKTVHTHPQYEKERKKERKKEKKEKKKGKKERKERRKRERKPGETLSSGSNWGENSPPVRAPFLVVGRRRSLSSLRAMSAPRTWLHQKLAKEREKEKEKAREKELRENERDQRERERERDRDRDRDRDREKELPRERERERDKAAERAAKEQRDEEREEGFLLPSFNNPSGLVTAQSLSTIPPTYDNPVMTRPGTISSGAPLAAGGLLTPAAGAPTAHAAGPAPAGTSLPPRPTKLSHMDLLDTSITGSTDLSGEKKPRIDHHRMPDSSILESKYVLGRKLGQ
ncbi:MAG: hypothetical protein BJ554DRAFT_7997, partial [Olpidium bornovanus]